ncbi:MAG: hypothetical protein Q4B54_09565, partial [Coriobacteriales bacterium]|nr:hypothetical protein [Coriobacteriales bacterium]
MSHSTKRAIYLREYHMSTNGGEKTSKSSPVSTIAATAGKPHFIVRSNRIRQRIPRATALLSALFRADGVDDSHR